EGSRCVRQAAGSGARRLPKQGRPEVRQEVIDQYSADGHFHTKHREDLLVQAVTEDGRQTRQRLPSLGLMAVPHSASTKLWIEKSASTPFSKSATEINLAAANE